MNARRGLVALVLVLAAAALCAQEAAAPFLRSMDVNRDGFVALKEWHGTSRAFLAYDRDRNGYLDVAELAQRAPEAKAGAAESGDSGAEVSVAIGSVGADPPEFFLRTCLVCHDADRILTARKDARGWAETVTRMRDKDPQLISVALARRITAFLEGRRREALDAGAALGDLEPVPVWAAIFDGVELHRFDRDGNGKLASRELNRLLLACLDFDGDGNLHLGEFRLMPVAADREAAFRDADRNRDGLVSARGLGVPDALLDLLDEDQDGALGPGEIPRARPGPWRLLLGADVDTVLAAADRNRDGELSRRELGDSGNLFELFDRARNGVLSRDELEEALNRSRAQGLVVSFDDFLTRYDLTGDGKVERREFSGPDHFFRRCDRDRDGVLTARDAWHRYQRPQFHSEAQRWR